MITIIAIALGGALGAIFRYILGNQISLIFGTNFPFSILIINVMGSFFMGMAIESFNLFSISNEPLQKFFTVGILGAFTTFSTFSLDAVDLILKNRISDAFIYVFASVILAIGFLFLGIQFIKLLT
jgi:CrcB protein